MEHLRSNQYNILHLGKYYPPYSGGIETHLRDLAVRQTSSATVRVIVSNNVMRHAHEVLNGVDITRVARLGVIASMPLCPGFVRAVRQCSTDLVHIHMPNPGAAYALLKSRHPGRIIVTHHADTMGRRALRRLSDPYVRYVLERASAIIATSGRYLESSEELLPYREKCRVIPLGIDPSHLAGVDNAEIEELRARYGGEFILAVGRLVPYKGFDILVRAMKSVDAILVLVGTGPLAERLQLLARSEGVSHKVKFVGRVGNLSPWLRAASFFVLPSVTRAEAFGIVQVEAMMAALPVINTGLDTGVPEVSVDGLTGITVPPGDVAALGKAMQLLVSRRDLRARFGKVAQARAFTEFTADLVAERTLSLYREVLES